MKPLFIVEIRILASILVDHFMLAGFDAAKRVHLWFSY